MRRWLAIGCGFLVVGLATLAWAQTTDGSWVSAQDGTREVTCVVPFVPGMTTPSGCSSGAAFLHFTSDVTVKVLRTLACQDLVIELNPDEDGTDTGAQVTLYRCSESGSFSANHCQLLKWDTDGDGVVDNAVLDGSTDMKVGVQNAQVTYLGVDITAVAGTPDDARLTVGCK